MDQAWQLLSVVIKIYFTGFLLSNLRILSLLLGDGSGVDDGGF